MSPEAQDFLDDARSKERIGTDPLPPDAERVSVSPAAQAFLDDARSRERTGTDPLPPDAERDGKLMEVAKLYQVADAESMAAAATYRRLLAAIALSSTALTVAFLLYDEAEAWYLILVVGVMLVVELVATKLATRSRCHERYVEMRVAAECLRVEAFLRYGGCGQGAKELLPWSIRHDIGWIEDVLDSLEPPLAGEPHHTHDRWAERQRAENEDDVGGAALDSLEAPRPKAPHDVRDCWIEGQRSYHEGAISSAAERCVVSRRVVHTSIVLSALLYTFTLGFELCCGGWAMPALMTIAHLERWRAALKICLGSVSAATIFVANYYDKLALDRTLADHQKMATLYELASARIEQEGQTEGLLRHLAREELAENATWCAYQQANDPEIVL